MDVSLRIAWRYLFSKKKRNAINIVSAVSAAGVTVVTAAMIVVFSVMNGFGDLVSKMFSQFDPQLKITAAFGKTFSTNEPFIRQVKELPQIEIFSPSIEETALIECGDRQVPATIKGVTQHFNSLTHIDSVIIEGRFAVSEQIINPDGTSGRRFEKCVLGAGLADKLSASALNMNGVKFYAPKHGEKINILRPDLSLNQSGAFVSGIFSIQQDKYDASYALVSLELARELFQLQEDEVSCIEIKLYDTNDIKKVKKQLKALAGDDFIVQDQYEQQADFFKVVQIEKLLTVLLLSFILLIAAFNIIGSLSMLMIDKQADIIILRNMGANQRQIQKIFLYVGWLIAILGALCGMVLGILACLLQQYFGIIKLGNGTDYIISAYPVVLQATDVLLTAIIVLALGFLSAWYPTKQLNTNNIQ